MLGEDVVEGDDFLAFRLDHELEASRVEGGSGQRVGGDAEEADEEDGEGGPAALVEDAGVVEEMDFVAVLGRRVLLAEPGRTARAGSAGSAKAVQAARLPVGGDAYLR